MRPRMAADLRGWCLNLGLSRFGALARPPSAPAWTQTQKICLQSGFTGFEISQWQTLGMCLSCGLYHSFFQLWVCFPTLSTQCKGVSGMEGNVETHPASHQVLIDFLPPLRLYQPLSSHAGLPRCPEQEWRCLALEHLWLGAKDNSATTCVD